MTSIFNLILNKHKKADKKRIQMIKGGFVLDKAVHVAVITFDEKSVSLTTDDVDSKSIVTDTPIDIQARLEIRCFAVMFGPGGETKIGSESSCHAIKNKVLWREASLRALNSIFYVMVEPKRGKE